MPTDKFRVSGRTSLPFKDNDPLWDLKETVGFLLGESSHSQSKKDLDQVKLDLKRSSIKIGKETIIDFHKLEINEKSIQNKILLLKEAGKDSETEEVKKLEEELKSLKDNHDKAIDKFSKLLEKDKDRRLKALCNLHQGLASSAQKIFVKNYRMGSSKNFIPIWDDREGGIKVMSSKNEDEFSYETKMACYGFFDEDGNQWAINKDGNFQKTEDEEGQPLTRSIEELKDSYKPLFELSSIASIDFTKVPPNKPLAVYEVDVVGKTPELKYVGPLMDEGIVQLKNIPFIDKVKRVFARKKPEAKASNYHFRIESNEKIKSDDPTRDLQYHLKKSISNLILDEDCISAKKNAIENKWNGESEKEQKETGISRRIYSSDEEKKEAIEAWKVKKGIGPKEVEEIEEMAYMNEMEKDLNRNAVEIDGVLFNKGVSVGTQSGEDELRKKLYEEFGLRRELAGLHQGRLAEMMSFCNENFEFDGKIGAFLLPDKRLAGETVIYKKEGNVYTYSCDLTAFNFLHNGIIYARRNGKIVSLEQPLISPPEEGNPLEWYKKNLYEPIMEQIGEFTVDLNNVPPNKPKVTVDVQVKLTVPEVKYILSLRNRIKNWFQLQLASIKERFKERSTAPKENKGPAENPIKQEEKIKAPKVSSVLVTSMKKINSRETEEKLKDVYSRLKEKYPIDQAEIVHIKDLKAEEKHQGGLEVIITRHDDKPEKDVLQHYQNKKGEIESTLSKKPDYKSIAIMFELNEGFFPLKMDECGDEESLIKIFRAAKFSGKKIEFSEKDGAILRGLREFDKKLTKEEEEILKKCFSKQVRSDKSKEMLFDKPSDVVREDRTNKPPESPKPPHLKQ